MGGVADLAERNPGGGACPRRSVYRLLCEVKIATKRPPWTAGVFLLFYVFLIFDLMLNFIQINFVYIWLILNTWSRHQAAEGICPWLTLGF